MGSGHDLTSLLNNPFSSDLEADIRMGMGNIQQGNTYQ
jgi:hypothetical protein